MAKLTAIEGIGESLAKKFDTAGVGNTNALLDRGGTRKGRQELAQRTGVDEGKILRFVNHADLMRVSGIGEEYSELLEAAGVDSVPELSRRSAASLHRKMVEINGQKKLCRQVASETQVQRWIDQAKSLDRAVHH